MKADWDTLASEFEGNDNVLIADVDCTSDGHSLCEKHHVKGYPTILTFKPGVAKGEVYEGARSLAALRKRATKLKPWDPFSEPWSYGTKIAAGLATLFAVWVTGSMLRIFP